MSQISSHQGKLQIIAVGRHASGQMMMFSKMINRELSEPHAKRLKREFRDDLVAAGTRLEDSARALARELDRIETGIDGPSVALEVAKSKRALKIFRDSAFIAAVLGGALGGAADGLTTQLVETVTSQLVETERSLDEVTDACAELERIESNPSDESGPTSTPDAERTQEHPGRTERQSNLESAYFPISRTKYGYGVKILDSDMVNFAVQILIQSDTELPAEGTFTGTTVAHLQGEMTVEVYFTSDPVMDDSLTVSLGRSTLIGEVTAHLTDLELPAGSPLEIRLAIPEDGSVLEVEFVHDEDGLGRQTVFSHKFPTPEDLTKS